MVLNEIERLMKLKKENELKPLESLSDEKFKTLNDKLDKILKILETTQSK